MDKDKNNIKKGPILNNTSYNFTARDSLGIEGVFSTLSGEICPVVTTVTPRAFYWVFLTWLYYDYHKFSSDEEKNYKGFVKHLRRQDYFFVLSVLISGTDEKNLVGKQQSLIDIQENTEGPYPYNDKYFKIEFGGMNYYYSGCVSMRLIWEKNMDDDTQYSFPKLSPLGEELAKSFEKMISETSYYKEYRWSNYPVPRDVLEEYGRIIRLDLDGFEDARNDLKKALFKQSQNYKLIESSDYLYSLVTQGGIEELSTSDLRQILFDYELPNHKEVNVADGFKTISREWEIVVGREYFTLGLEMIWKHMMNCLDGILSADDWIRRSIDSSEFSWSDDKTIGEFLNDCSLPFVEREKTIYDAQKNKNVNKTIENGIKLMLSIYNRFAENKDYEEQSDLFRYGMDSDSISMYEFFVSVKENIDTPIQEYLRFVMKEWLIQKHYRTAFEKMLQKRDGFFYQVIDGKYMKKYDFQIDFQEIRLRQLFQVMKDLKMI